MGKKTDKWNRTRAKLKRIFEAAGITRCEMCFGTFALGFAHSKKRRFIQTDEDWEEVALLCQPCHEKIEHSGHDNMLAAVREIIRRRTAKPNLALDTQSEWTYFKTPLQADNEEKAMSRSNNNVTANPCTRWFEWSGSTGQLKYWDKEKSENVFIELPFTFLVLDQLSTVTGYSDEAQSGIWSNEVRDLRNEPLTVRTKIGIIGKGLYNSVKGLNGARFTKSLYIAYYDEAKQLQIGNLKATGACLSAWIEFSRGRNVYQGAVVLAGSTQAKKGATKYFIPNFEIKEAVSEATDNAAKELDKKLQTYLNEYLDVSHAEAEATQIEDMELEMPEFEKGSIVKQFEDDEIPF